MKIGTLRRQNYTKHPNVTYLLAQIEFQKQAFPGSHLQFTGTENEN